MWLYNIGIYIYTALIRFSALWYPKARQWSRGRKGLFEEMRARISDKDRVLWLHAASLGEFEQGRPIIERIREEYPDYKILLTFFSPSGYEVRKNYGGADFIFYLPADTPSNARRFLELAHPEVAIFVKSEFWLNILTELNCRGVRTYLVSAIFRRNSVFFKPYGWLWRRALNYFNAIFVQDENSRELLGALGLDRVVVAGDTRFDRVQTISASVREVPIVKEFKGESRLFVAGSTWGADEELLLSLINENPDIKFVVAPHEMDAARIGRLMQRVRGGAVRYTECGAKVNSEAQVLVLDIVGLLSSVYKYADWAYIGGGFGAGIHNTLEAATFGVPIAFGVRYKKFKEAVDMVALGAACSVANAEELRAWFAPLRDDAEYLARVGGMAREYTLKNCGATDKITKSIFG